MANAIVFKYAEMKAAAGEIKAIATQYKTAATSFETSFLAAISGWEGESKDKLQNFISGTVKTYTSDSIPKLLEALADLLLANATQMENADQQIAANIPN